MKPGQFVSGAVFVFIAMSVCWLLLASDIWNWTVALISVMPLLVMLVLMSSRKTVVYFYAALVSMPYLATALTQIVMTPTGRVQAVACLAFGLVYLAGMRLTLKALKAGT